jgi:hypothetical protein
MIIRTMTDSDIPALVNMGERMHTESVYRDLTFDPIKAMDNAFEIIENPETMLGLVAEQDGELIGMATSYVMPYEHGPDLVSGDMLVFVDYGHRGSSAFVRMMQARVAWAQSKGAKMIFMGTSTGVNTEQTAALLEHMGYEKIGYGFLLKEKTT